MRYVRARMDQYERDEMYRIYVTSSLQAISQGQTIVPTYYELLRPQQVDERSEEEIALDIMTRAGLRFGD